MTPHVQQPPLADLYAAFNSFRASRTALVALGGASSEARSVLAPAVIDQISSGMDHLARVRDGLSEHRALAGRAHTAATEAVALSAMLATHGVGPDRASSLAGAARQALAGAMEILRPALPAVAG